ncbi:MAG: helix-turn-helix domain-containing protein [Terriglobales bacterium]
MPSQLSKGRPFKKFYCDRDEVFQMPANAFKVWMYHYRMEGKDRKSWPSRDTLCRKLGISLDTLKTSRRWLVKHGWLKKIGERNSDGEFAVPVFRVTRGDIPTVVGKTAHGKTQQDGGKTPPRSRVEKPSTVAGGKTAQEVDVKKQLDTSEVYTGKTAPAFSNQNPKPSAKENKKLACIRDWAWKANPKAVFMVADDQELAEAFNALQQQCGTGLDKFVKQSVRNRSAAMDAQESEMAGHLIAVNLLSDVRALLGEPVQQAASA